MASTLDSSIEKSFDVLGQQIQVSQRGVADQFEKTNAPMKQWAVEARQRHDQSMAALENIQRRRKPIGERFFEGLRSEPFPKR
jgi:hypothetical protein